MGTKDSSSLLLEQVRKFLLGMLGMDKGELCTLFVTREYSAMLYLNFNVLHKLVGTGDPIDCTNKFTIGRHLKLAR